MWFSITEVCVKNFIPIWEKRGFFIKQQSRDAAIKMYKKTSSILEYWGILNGFKFNFLVGIQSK